MTILILIIIVILTTIYEVPPLIREKRYKELILFSGLLFFGSTLVILEGLGVTVPNPFDALTSFFKPMNDLLKAIFG